jgi:KaiC/GvpD/RAD55 family RecA-like ATPase
MRVSSKMDDFNENVNLANNSINRISTGINRLDELLSGGLPFNSITLVSGSPGSGKTILCYHYLWEGLNSGEKCLFITSDERITNIIKQAKQLGFEFKSWIEAGKIKFIFLDLDSSSIYKEIEEEIKSGNYSRIVLDSITPVSEVPVWATGIHEITPSDYSSESKKYPIGSIPATRMHVRRIMSIFTQNNCTALITSEVSCGTCNYSRDTISEFLADGIIYLDLDTTMDRRKLTIRKMRSTKHTLKPQDIVIAEGGIKFI